MDLAGQRSDERFALKLIPQEIVFLVRYSECYPTNTLWCSRMDQCFILPLKASHPETWIGPEFSDSQMERRMLSNPSQIPPFLCVPVLTKCYAASSVPREVDKDISNICCMSD